MNLCRCHNRPSKGSFQPGAEYKYSYGIDFISVMDDDGNSINFDEYTFLWYFTKL